MDVTKYAISQFIPHPMMLFAAGTYDEDGTANLTLISWVSFYWDRGLGITLCMDGNKSAKRNFERTGGLTLNALVRDQIDTVSALGRAHGSQKALIASTLPLETSGRVAAPLLAESPLSYEVELVRQIVFEGSDLYLGAIRGVQSGGGDLSGFANIRGSEAPRVSDVRKERAREADGSYDILRVEPLLASQREYCFLTEESSLGTWC